MGLPADKGLLKNVVKDLMAYGADVAVFGGWAEELRATIEPRQHSDVDLLFRGESFTLIDDFMREKKLLEIVQKHFPHKRAFEYRGVRVELFLVRRSPSGWSTPFWGTVEYEWPPDVWGDLIEGMSVVSAYASAAFRRDHDSILRPQHRAKGALQSDRSSW